VGKSSLLNALIGRKNLARTSATPGKTRALNYYLVNGDGGFYLVDLPGFGYAKTSQKQRVAWQRLIGEYITQREELRVMFHLIDSRHEPTKLDMELIEIMRGSHVPRVILLTKADKLSKNQQRTRVSQLERKLAGIGIELPIVLTSAEAKTGMKEVWKWVETLL
ncbi:MAG: ribosome biogenesis GTP-binding protein YihA/YsxC, partial [Rubricoccaceae bacterium]|nr:ribosome biogenesis GTP-binding protein YihA/YsxC [Rubricoccaceae bacterium]